MENLGRVSSSVAVAMENCVLASGLSRLCSAEASLASSRVGVASTLSSIAKSALSIRVRAGGGGYITPAAWGVCNALERGIVSTVAPKWAGRLQSRCRLGGAQHFRAGEKISTGLQMGWVAT